MASRYVIDVVAKGDASQLVREFKAAAQTVGAASKSLQLTPQQQAARSIITPAEKALTRSASRAVESRNVTGFQQSAAYQLGKGEVELRRLVTAAKITQKEADDLRKELRSLVSSGQQQLAQRGLRAAIPTAAAVTKAATTYESRTPPPAAQPRPAQTPPRPSVAPPTPAENAAFVAKKALEKERSRGGAGDFLALEDLKKLVGGRFGATDDEVKQVQAFLQRPDLGAVLGRHGKFAAAERNVGLAFGGAEEREFAKQQKEPIPGLGVTPLEMRTLLTRLREMRELVEQIARIQDQLTHEEARVLIAKRGELGVLRQQRRLAYRQEERNRLGLGGVAARIEDDRATRRFKRERDIADIATEPELDKVRRAHLNVAKRRLTQDQRTLELGQLDAGAEARFKNFLADSRRKVERERRAQTTPTQVVDRANAELERERERNVVNRTRYASRTDADRANRGEAAADRDQARRDEQRRVLARRSAQQEADDLREQQKFAHERNRALSEIYGIPKRGGLGYVFDQGQGGTRTQRFQTLLSARAGGGSVPRAPEDNARLSQILGGGLLTSAKFAFSGAALYGVLSTIGDIVREAEQLNRIFKLIEAQFESIGQTADFAGFRRDVLEIARDAGISGDEVANVAFQLKGAYGTDTQRAIRETSAAFKVSLVTGLEQRELTDSLTAASKAYGVSIEEIGDKAIGLEERFGVLARESLKVFGDLASVARDAGLELNEIGAIIGVIQQASGRGGASIAEGLGRVLPAIGERRGEIVRLYNLVPQLRDGLGEVTGALREGRTGDVLVQLLRDFDSLDAATQKYVITLLGGRREAQFLIPLFQNASKAVEEFGRKQSDAGKLEQRFTNVQKTATQTIAQLREEIRQLGDSLARAGLLDAFVALAVVLERTVSVAGDLLRWGAEFDDAMANIPGRVLAVVVAVKALQVALKGVIGFRAALAASTVGQAAAAAGQTAIASGSRTAAFSQAGIFAALTGGKTGAAGLLRLGGVGALAGITGAVLNGALLNGGNVERDESGDITDIRSSRFLGIPYAGLGAASTDAKGAADENKSVFESKDFFDLQEIKKSGVYKYNPLSSELTSDLLGGEIGLVDFFKNNTKAKKQLDEAIKKETIDAFKVAKDAGLLKRAPDDLDDLLTQLEQDGKVNIGGGKKQKASERAQELLLSLGASERRQIEVFTDLQKKRADILATEGEAQLRSVADMESAFAAGEVSFAELRRTYESELAALVSVDDGNDEAFHNKVLELRRRMNKAVEDNLVQGARTVQSLRELSGQKAFAAVPDFAALLSGIRPTQSSSDYFSSTGDAAAASLITDPNQRYEIATQIAQLQQQGLQDAIANASTAADALGIAQKGVVLNADAKRAIIDSQIALYGRVLFPPPDVLKADKEQIDQLLNAQVEERIAQLQARNAGLEEDPVRDAGVAEEIATMRRDAALARGTATEVANAELALAQARKQRRDAMDDLLSAQHELAVAIADAAGDVIGSARIQAAEARRLYEQARGRGADKAELDRLQAQAVSTAAQQRDTILSEQQRQIDVALELERITVGQAIAELEALLRFPEITQQQIDDLLIKIKGLRDEASRDFQFHLGDLRVPTLYEVRRTRLSEQAGIGYQDNRQVNAVFYVNNGMDLEAAREFFAQAAGQPVRVLGTTPRPY